MAGHSPELTLQSLFLMFSGSSTFLVGKAGGIGFSGGAYDTGKSVSTDIGAG
jgi:hypothetical protein